MKLSRICLAAVALLVGAGAVLPASGATKPVALTRSVNVIPSTARFNMDAYSSTLQKYIHVTRNQRYGNTKAFKKILPGDYDILAHNLFGIAAQITAFLEANEKYTFIFTLDDTHTTRIIAMVSDAVSAPVLRIVNASPDAGQIDVLIDGQLIADNLNGLAATLNHAISAGSHAVVVRKASNASQLLASTFEVTQTGGTHVLIVHGTVDSSDAFPIAQRLVTDLTKK